MTRPVALSLNQMTIKQLVAARTARRLRRSGHRRGRPVARPGRRTYGVEAAGQAGPRRRASGHHPLPRRLLHRRPGERARPSPTTAARSTRRRRSAPTPSSWSPAASRRARATCTAPASGSPTRSPTGPVRRRHGVRLAIEPLHPMFAADRCVVSTLAQALDLAERFPARPGRRGRRRLPHLVGPLTWRRRSPRARILAFQLADWVLPLPGGRAAGRGQLGDGCADLARAPRVAATGYDGLRSRSRCSSDRVWAMGRGRGPGGLAAFSLSRPSAGTVSPAPID